MRAFESFRAVRWLRTVNLVLQAVLFLTLLGGLNYLAGDHAGRFDLTRFRRFTLSAETQSYLRDLPRPVHIVVTMNGGTDDPDKPSPEVRGLLGEYAHATESNRDGRVTVDYVDVYRDRRAVEKYGVDQADVVLLVCGDKRRALPLGELYQVVDRQRRSFVGERVVTSAILDVSHPERKRIYFLVGHGELRPDGNEGGDPARGLSGVRDELRLRNYDVDTLELAREGRIPADASLLVCVAPVSRFTALEEEMLRQYLGPGAGRLILFLAPGTQPGLGSLLLDDWGILVDDDQIMDTGADNLTEDGDLMIRAIQPHPVTHLLFDYQMALRMGPARSVRPLPGRTVGGLSVVTLAATSTTAWGEVAYRQRGPQSFTEGVDIRGLQQIDPPGRLGVAVASERVGARGDLPFSVPGGRIVVVGSGDLISNARIVNQGTELFFLGAVDWTVGRDTPLNAPARPIERFQLSLSAAELARLRYLLMLGLPAAFGVLGFGVYLARRN